MRCKKIFSLLTVLCISGSMILNVAACKKNNNKDDKGAIPSPVSTVETESAHHVTNSLHNVNVDYDKPIGSYIKNGSTEYDGENTKVSCDKIALENELISAQWTSFVTAFENATEEKIKGKINGYVLFGESKTDGSQTITFIKTANPITNLTNKKSVVFTTTANDELEMFSDTVCRLFLNTDIVVIGQTMYTFNHNFEALFDLEKTMAKAKVAAIEKMVDTNSIAAPETFKEYASQYTSTRTFITLKQERIDRVTDKRKRKAVASMLKIDLDESGDFIIDSKEKASYLIKYLCYKIFKDGETKDILEASTISTLSIS